MRQLSHVFLTAFVALLPCAAFAQDPVPVETVTAHWQAYAKPVLLSGTLENKSEQNLAFKVGGLIRQISAYEGQWVQQGDVLAALNLEEVDAQVAKAQSVLDNAERNLRRFEDLRNKNALSEEQLQAAQTQVEVARSDLTVAKFNQRHSVIRAPSEGRVLKRFIERNEMVAPGAPAFLFAPKKEGWVLRSSVTDRERMRLTLKDTAQVQLDTYPGVVFNAHINELAARAGALQTFDVELMVDADPNHPFLAGLVGQASITPSQTQQLIRLPATALVRVSPSAQTRSATPLEAHVYVAKQQRAELRRLPLLGMSDDSLLVASGLEEGDQVVTSGAAYLSDGRALVVTPLVAQ